MEGDESSFEFRFIVLVFVEDGRHELWTGFIEPKNTVTWMALPMWGGVQGTEKLHSSECSMIFFFSRTLLRCTLWFDVDFIIWFLKRWYFSGKKTKPLWMFLYFLAGNFQNLLLNHFFIQNNSAYIKYSPTLGLFHLNHFVTQHWSIVDGMRLHFPERNWEECKSIKLKLGFYPQFVQTKAEAD